MSYKSDSCLVLLGFGSSIRLPRMNETSAISSELQRNPRPLPIDCSQTFRSRISPSILVNFEKV